MRTPVKRMVLLAVALAWFAGGVARADDPVILAFSGISVSPGKNDEAMNRALADNLATHGIEVYFVSPLASSSRPDSDARFYGQAVLQGTARTRVRSSRGDSPETEMVSFARCRLAVWRFDEEGRPETLFDDTVVVPVSGDPPDTGAAVPKALAERIAAVVEEASLQDECPGE